MTRVRPLCGTVRAYRVQNVSRVRRRSENGSRFSCVPKENVRVTSRAERSTGIERGIRPRSARTPKVWPEKRIERVNVEEGLKCCPSRAIEYGGRAKLSFKGHGRSAGAKTDLIDGGRIKVECKDRPGGVCDAQTSRPREHERESRTYF